MELALQEATTAAQEGEVPIGAVAVRGDQLLARDHNRSVQLHDPTAHAELLVLRKAGSKISNYRLNGVEIYVTVEPCAMCAGALIWSRVKRLIFAARDDKSGAVYSRISLLTSGLFNHKLEIVEGILAEPSRQILRKFFSARRA